MSRLSIALAALLCSAGAAAAQAPGDAAFCRSYAASTALVAEDAIRINSSCQDFSKGVHGAAKMHADWCARTDQSSVEGAATHIRRLANACTNGQLARPNDYGGYDIVGNERYERQYGQTRGWQVFAAFSGRTLMYCLAVNPADRGVKIGRDVVQPGSSAQWQLAVPVKSTKDWQGTFEVDGRGAGKGATDISGTAIGSWTIAWFSMAEVDAVRQGRQAVLGVGKADFDFGLDGVAAAITKIEECVERKGEAPSAASAAPEPAAMATNVAADASSPNVPHPFEITVSSSPKARARLVKMGEKIKVLAMYSGEPVPSKKKLADEVGEIGLGDGEEVVLSADGGTAHFTGELPRKKIGWVKEPMLLVNVVSARLKHQDNLLHCTLFQDTVAVAQERPIQIHCKLIDEN